MGDRRYQAKGFIPISNPPERITRLAAAVSIKKGDALIDDGNGYATNTATDFAATFMGIAAADCDNSEGNAGDKSVEVYVPDDTTQWIVPVDGNAKITQTIVGTKIDLGADCGHVAVNDTVTEGYAFYVDKIDASTNAVAAHTYGYAIGRIITVGTQG